MTRFPNATSSPVSISCRWPMIARSCFAMPTRSAHASAQSPRRTDRNADRGPGMATVEFKKLVKSYGPIEVVHAIDLKIADGEFIVLVGPSGCGKSTTLRMLAGLEEVNDGKIFIGDKDITKLPPKDRDIAMVFQNYALYPHMSVADNMAFSLKMAKMPADQRKKAVEEAARILNLTEYLDRKPKALSGGQRQRVA